MQGQVAPVSFQRAIDWAVATGRCSESEGARHLSKMKRMVPLELFVAGRWMPPVFDVDTQVYGEELIAVFDAWEQAQVIVLSLPAA